MKARTPQVIEPEGITADLALEHLKRLELSDTFNALEHQRRLVRFLIEQRIAGRQEPFTQTEIVFAKLLSASTPHKAELLFPDEQAVRTHVSRLRKSLLAYYKYEAPEEPIQIDIPKGTYVAKFLRPTAPSEAGNTTATAPKFRSPETLNKTGVRHYRRGEYDKAETILKDVLEIREKSLGPEHPDTATSINNLAMLYEKLGRNQEALPLLERALKICEKSLGGEHPETLIGVNNLAIVYMNLARYKESAAMFERALAIREQVLGPEHPDTATSLSNLAMQYEALGRYKEAIPLLDRALTIREKLFGDHPDTATVLNNLAMVYKELARYKEAAPLLERALAICEKILGPEHPQTVVVRDNYVELSDV